MEPLRYTKKVNAKLYTHINLILTSNGRFFRGRTSESDRDKKCINIKKFNLSKSQSSNHIIESDIMKPFGRRSKDINHNARSKITRTTAANHCLNTLDSVDTKIRSYRQKSKLTLILLIVQTIFFLFPISAIIHETQAYQLSKNQPVLVKKLQLVQQNHRYHKSDNSTQEQREISASIKSKRVFEDSEEKQPIYHIFDMIGKANEPVESIKEVPESILGSKSKTFMAGCSFPRSTNQLARPKRETTQSETDSLARHIEMPTCHQLQTLWTRLRSQYPALAARILATDLFGLPMDGKTPGNMLINNREVVFLLERANRLLTEETQLGSANPSGSRVASLLARFFANPNYHKLLRQYRIFESLRPKESHALKNIDIFEQQNDHNSDQDPSQHVSNGNANANANLDEMQYTSEINGNNRINAIDNLSNQVSKSDTSNNFKINNRKESENESYGRVIYYPHERQSFGSETAPSSPVDDTLDKLHFIHHQTKANFFGTDGSHPAMPSNLDGPKEGSRSTAANTSNDLVSPVVAVSGGQNQPASAVPYNWPQVMRVAKGK